MTDQDKRREEITALKQPDELLMNLADMLNLASDSITVHDNEGHFLYANQKTFELYGYNEADFMTVNVHVLEVPESTALLSERFRLIEESVRASYEVAYYHKDGHEIPIEVFTKKVEWKGQTAASSIATDITERLQDLVASAISDEEIKNVRELKQTGTLRNAESKLSQNNDQILDVTLDGKNLTKNENNVFVKDPIERKLAEQELKRNEWLLTSKNNPFGKKEQAYLPPYGDLVELNTCRFILDSVGEQTLTDIVSDHLNLLDTSAAVYERNGDYALGIFSSGWCRFMDAASRGVCGTNDNRAALESGRWHCHESCWSCASKTAIETGQPADIECAGGIRLFAVPIRVGDDIIGAINFGYDDPPRDEAKLWELATNYQVSYEELCTLAMNYESRLPHIIDLAKSRLMTSARLIGDITGRKQAEQALKLSEARFKNMFERHSSIMLLIKPESGIIIGAKEASVRFYGYSKAELLSMRIDEINALTPEKIKVERELADREERYALVINASEQGLWDWNVETNEVFFSEQWKKQIGYQDHELKNEFNTWDEHLHPDERENCLNAVNSYLGQPVEHFLLEFRFLHKDGSYRWIHNKAASLINKEGKVIRLFGIHTDITESKLSQAIFKDIVEKKPMSIQILDMEGYPIQINSAQTKLIGVETPSDYSVLKDPQLLSQGFGELFDLIKKGEVVYFPDSYYNVHDVDKSFPDSPIWVKALGFTLNDNAGKPDRIVLMHENITKRNNAEALLNDIIYKNPMSIQIVDKAGIALNGNPAYIHLIEKSGARMLNIINEIVDISKIEAGLMETDMTETDINEMMDFAYRFFQPEVESKGMTLLFQSSSKSREVIIKTDKVKLKAILFNLIKNAIKYKQKGFVEFGYSLKTHCYQGERPDQDELEFFVKDTGIGIPADRQEAIFERFIQADVLAKNAFRSVGLGLSISKAYVEMLGGHIRVESKEGAGSTFYFSVPYHSRKRWKEREPDTERKAGAPGQTSNKELQLKIFPVENDEASELFISEALKGISSVILRAETGIQAVNCCRDNPDIDLALMDIRMSEMDEYTAYAASASLTTGSSSLHKQRTDLRATGKKHLKRELMIIL